MKKKGLIKYLKSKETFEDKLTGTIITNEGTDTIKLRIAQPTLSGDVKGSKEQDEEISSTV